MPREWAPVVLDAAVGPCAVDGDLLIPAGKWKSADLKFSAGASLHHDLADLHDQPPEKMATFVSRHGFLGLALHGLRGEAAARIACAAPYMPLAATTS